MILKNKLCQAQYKLELAKFWFCPVVSLKFDCLVQTEVVAIVNNQILSLDKLHGKILHGQMLHGQMLHRQMMDKCCMDKCCMVKWYWATCQQSRMAP